MTDSHEALSALITHQHRVLRAMSSSVRQAHGDLRGEAFDQFRQFLAAHEAAERRYVHLDASRRGGDGPRAIVAARIREEEELAESIRSLEQNGTSSNEFTALLIATADELDAHMQCEEYQELPAISGGIDDDAAIAALNRVPSMAQEAIGDADFADWLDRATGILVHAGGG